VFESNLLIESVSSQENSPSPSLPACLKQASKLSRKTEGIKAAPRRGVETDPPGVSVHFFFSVRETTSFLPITTPSKNIL